MIWRVLVFILVKTWVPMEMLEQLPQITQNILKNLLKLRNLGGIKKYQHNLIGFKQSTRYYSSINIK